MPGSFPPLESLVPRYIQTIEPYIPSKPDDVLRQMFGCPLIYRLNNNENALGPSPKALEALAAMDLFQASVYPSGDAFHLRTKLAERFGFSPDSFIVGNGANEVIAFVIKAFCQEGERRAAAGDINVDLAQVCNSYQASKKALRAGQKASAA